MKVNIESLDVECRVVWDWSKAGPVYETGPRSFEIDIILESPDPIEAQRALIDAAKKGCFLEQTLGHANSIRHRLKVGDGFIDT